ncbi:hypothetical protein PXK58_08990 [Phaeobacter gallaeciensis]|uniref:hypothetical protein n=1 Tax=Phaeobacter gallaeciensis TaxID=60890 RepID=UPI002380856B|nr:hypothetical protein [Phaeobacter gallaeciensis]MDE4274739.1 hypothetical protein [Phaeobacter gallaeciensis]MDE4299687.1 hypothetical protein [Phaeobacter gallaeciensis]MDE5184852.1 hypothetical protein [Phaeobacter gallaeciensis]
MKDKTYILGLMMLHEFKTKVETFLKETGISPSFLGRKALNDPGFVFGLRNGLEPRESTRAKVLRWMDKAQQDRSAA